MAIDFSPTYSYSIASPTADTQILAAALGFGPKCSGSAGAEQLNQRGGGYNLGSRGQWGAPLGGLSPPEAEEF